MTSVQLSDNLLALIGPVPEPALDAMQVIYDCPNCQAQHTGPFGLVIKSLVTAEKQSYVDKSVLAEWVGCDLCQDTIEANLGAPSADAWVTVYTLTVGDSQRFDRAVGLLRLKPTEREARYLDLLARVGDPHAWEETEHLLSDIDAALREAGRV